MRTISLAIATVFFIVTNLSGQNFQYITYHGEGVPFSHVNEVIEDQHNFLWVASDRGLFRFDGTRFEDFNISLKSRYINSLAALNDSTYLFSNDAGVYSFSYEQEKVVINPVELANASAGSMEYPGQIFVDSQKRLWIAQRNGTLFLKAALNTPPQPFKLASVETELMYFGEDAYGIIWVLLPGNGVYYFDDAQGTFIGLALPQPVNHFLVEGNQIIFGGEGLERWTLDANQQVVDKELLVASDLRLRYVKRDLNGTLFLVSDDGIYTFQTGLENPLKPVFGSNDPHRVEELPYRIINQLYFSTSKIRPGGTLWVCTPSGLGLMFASFFKSVNGMSHDNVFALGNGPDSEVLISLGNVYGVEVSETIEQFEELPDLNRITSISTVDGNTWYGSADGVLTKSGRQGSSQVIDLSERGGGIFYSFADSRGAVWFCQAPTENPLVGIGKVHKDGRLKYYDEQDGLDSRILVAGEGGKSELYVAGIGAETYLYKYDNITDTFVNHSRPFTFAVSRNFEVHDISVDKKGMVWMGTTDGLLKYDTERVYRIDLGEFTEQEIRAVCSLADGALWIATDTRGLIHLGADGNYVHFDEKSGTPSKIASYRCMMVDALDRLWVGTAEGVVYSSMKNPAPLKTPAPTLTSVQVNNRIIKKPQVIQLGRNDRVSLHFTSLAYPGKECQYQFKTYRKGTETLAEANSPWSTSDSGGQITLSQLEGGNHTLLVRAQQPGGYAWSAPTEIPLRIRKIWYATWWGICLLMLLSGLFLWYGVRLWVIRKVGQLEATIFQAKKELHDKETQLVDKEKALISQREEIKSMGVNTYLLHRLLRQIPEKSDWHTALPYLEKLVQMPTGIDTISLAFLKKGRLIHLGFKRLGSGMFRRESEFSEKDNLASYVLNSKKPLLIGNYELEAAQYINYSEPGGYKSRMYVPFRYSGTMEAVFCAYSTPANLFGQINLTEIQILVLFLTRNIRGQLKEI